MKSNYYYYLNPSSTVINLILCSCFTTEILEGFDVQRTIGLADTLKKYVYLTQAITQYYNSEFSEEQCIRAGVCPPFDEFVKRCQDLDKMTVSDVFAIQLMQVCNVFERKDYHPLFDKQSWVYYWYVTNHVSIKKRIMDKINLYGSCIVFFSFWICVCIYGFIEPSKLKGAFLQR